MRTRRADFDPLVLRWKETVFDDDHLSTVEKLDYLKEYVRTLRENVRETSEDILEIERAIKRIDPEKPYQKIEKPKAKPQEHRTRIAPEVEDQIKDLLKAHPERSNAWLARDTGVSADTIRNYRESMEITGKIPELEHLFTEGGKRFKRRYST